MPSQPTLRPFDVAVALRLLLTPEERYEPLSDALVTSTSAVHRSVARLQLAGLCKPGGRTIIHSALKEFLLHGVRFAFPAVHGPERTGVATGWTQASLVTRTPVGQTARVMVWATETGTVRGGSLVPLFPNVPAVAARDPRLHELLAMVDVLRTGTVDERRAVAALLGEQAHWGQPGGVDGYHSETRSS